MSFKHKYIIEETQQAITVSLIETEKDWSEFHIKVLSDKPIKGIDLAYVLSLYAEKIYDETKPASSEESQ